MSGVDIRAATLGDVAAITRIYADAVTRGTATFEASRRTRPK
jgi:L-amino acid N-acyltransferase YncA